MKDIVQITNSIVRAIHREKSEDYKMNVIALLAGTASAESNGRHLIQKGIDTARSFWQVEPFTGADVWRRYLTKPRKQIPLSRITAVCGVANFSALAENQNAMRWVLTYNIAYACITARLVYIFKPEAIPDADDLQGLAEYWKRHYNTRLGKGTTKHFIAMWGNNKLSRLLNI